MLCTSNLCQVLAYYTWKPPLKWWLGSCDPFWVIPSEFCRKIWHHKCLGPNDVSGMAESSIVKFVYIWNISNHGLQMTYHPQKGRGEVTWPILPTRGYASALLVVIMCRSVRLSVCPTVTAKPRITQTMSYDSTGTLVHRSAWNSFSVISELLVEICL